MQDNHAHKRGADKVCELAEIYLHAVICEGNEIAPNVAVRRALEYASTMVQARNQLMKQADEADGDGNGGETTREEAIASAESAQAEPVDDRDLDFEDPEVEVETKTEPAPPPAPEKAAEGSANSVDSTPASS